MEFAVSKLDHYIERNGLSLNLVKPKADPEFFLIFCSLDSFGRMENIELFLAENSTHGSYYRDKILPGIRQIWLPQKNKYRGIIIPVFIFPGSSQGPQVDRFSDLENFFYRLWLDKALDSKIYLARDAIVSYNH